ncbi:MULTISPECIES: hypothetical protein [Actinopolyspora]|uniref:Uncharacterized protein n=1 Tax=Actinopolyspora saharensis TaxID=995062 RepID=A0A1H1ARU6_9ACTN|nr:hypothetical protein [Actinopolyspora saharensis]NHD17115.1 hypothetical protein [Actinopolyspora sp. BKK2]NHE76267.1 hypothetical protein [Actinopolyspora sp. BKK1]SDQ42427.1 hypothetical protein SAMN04489718_1709 [Actinopolyspora saharensis]
MLVIVLLLLIGAAGVLVFAVSAGVAQWAWLSVLLCVIAGFVLLLARRRDRARAAVSSGPRHSVGTSDRTSREQERPERVSSAAEVEEPSGGGPAAAPGGSGADRLTDSRDGLVTEPDFDTEPPEQETDAADVLLVADSAIDVFVIDERPRYHRGDCSWVGERTTLPLPVREARELGFTPCSVCRPDRSIAEEEHTKE